MAELRLEPRPQFCIPPSSLEAGDVGLRLRRTRPRDRYLGAVMTAWEERSRELSRLLGQNLGWPFFLVSIADLNSIKVANSTL